MTQITETNLAQVLDHLRQEISQLHVHNRVFWITLRKLQRNPRTQGANHFVDWMVSSYVSDTTIRIRRLMDMTRGVISLAKLLETIAATGELRSRKRHFSLYLPREQHWAERTFNGMLTACKIKNAVHISHFPKDVVLGHKEHLKRKMRRILDFSNEWIAHQQGSVVLGKNQYQGPTFTEFKRTINEIDSRFRFYRLLLTASYGRTLMPYFQDPWERIFDVPWNEKRS